MKSIVGVTLLALILGSIYLIMDSQLNNLQNQISQAPQYDKGVSKIYGAYAKIAYCPEDKIKNWSCKDCETYNKIQDLKIISNSKRDIFAFIFYDTILNKIVLSWRGSIDFKNYITDLQIIKIPYTCTFCEVHAGVYEGYRTVAKQIEQEVSAIISKYPGVNITTTGHSLGAALAAISAIQINKKHTKLVNEIHNFGCPRFGNAKLAAYIYNLIPRTFRIVHNHDILAHLPEQTQNYAHYPWQILYDLKMQNYIICDDTGEDPSCSNSYSPNYNAADHHFYFFPMNQTNC